MEDVYKVVMDVTGATVQADLLSKAIDQVSERFEKMGAKFIKVNDEGAVVQVTLEGINKVGQQQTTILRHLENGWSEVSNSFGKVSDKIKGETRDITNLLSNLNTRIKQEFTVSQDQINKFELGRVDREIEEFVKKSGIGFKELNLIITNLNNGFTSLNGISANGLQFQNMVLARNRMKQDLGPQLGPGGDINSIAAAAEFIRLNPHLATQKEKVDHLLLSWENFGRYMISHAAYQGIYGVMNSLQAATSRAMELSKAISLVQTLDQGNAGSKAWNDSIIKLSNQFGTDPVELAKSYYSALSNQMGNTVDEIESFTRATQKFALTTNSTAEEANNLFASFVNSYGMNVAQVTELSAQLFKTIDLGRIKASDMANTIGRVIAPAAALGVSALEVQSALAVITQTGVRPADAMTQMLNVMNELIKPSKEFAGTIKEWGYSSGEAAIKSEGFMSILQRIVKEGESGGLAKLGAMFNDIRGFRGIVSLTQHMEKFKTTMVEIASGGEQYEKAFQERLENPAASLERQMQRLHNIFNTTFTSLIGLTDTATKSVGGLDNAFLIMLPTIATLGGAAGVGGVVLAFRSLVPLLKEARFLINPWVGAAILAGTGLATLTTMIYKSKTEFDNLINNAMPAAFDTKTYEKSVIAAEAAAVKQRELILVHYTNTNKTAEEYYKQLDTKEEQYREAVKETTDAIKDAFKDRMSEVKSSITETKNLVKELDSAITSLQRNISKDDIGSKLEGKSDIAKYKILSDRADEVVGSMRSGTPQQNIEYAKELESINNQIEALVKASYKKKDDTRNLDLRSEKETLEAKKRVLQDEIKAVNIHNGELEEHKKKGQKVNKTSTSEKEKAVLGIDKRLAEIEKEQNKEALDLAIKKQAAVKEELKDAQELQRLEASRLDTQKEALKLLKDQHEQAKQKEEAAKREEVNVKKAQYKFAINDKDFQDILKRSKDPGYLDNKDQVSHDKFVMNQLPALMLESMQAGGLKPSASDIARINAGPVALNAVSDEAASAKRKQEETDKTRASVLAANEAELKKAQADEAIIAGRRRDFLGMAQALHPGKTEAELVAMASAPSEKIKHFGMGISNQSTIAEDPRDRGILKTLGLLVKQDIEAQQKVLAATAKTGDISKLDPSIDRFYDKLNAPDGLKGAIDKLAQAVNGLAPPAKAMGGLGSDTVPTMLAPGEFVVNSRAAARWSTQLMNMNNGTHMASGGSVNSVNVGDINVSLTSQGSAQMDALQIGHALKREIRRGTLKW
jgi:TP901 family phage tail tape measure protein